MNEKIKVAIVGYGNLAKGVELALANPENSDMELSAIFTRRDPNTIISASGTPVVSMNNIAKYAKEIDVAILCGGSAKDLPQQGPEIAKLFNTVDSYDTHNKIPQYLEAMNKACEEAGTTSVFSVGWDPGIFSIERAFAGAFLPGGNTYTFWGPGISQGHSDAVRKIEGVKNAKQYTIPIDRAMNEVRAGNNPTLSTREKHKRVCYVVPEEGADYKKIADDIKKMPDYFSDYNVEVNFISEEEFNKNHSEMPHGGFVIHSGKTGEHNQIIEHSLKLESNPEFTGSVLVAYARAASKMHKSGMVGAKTVFDIPPAWLYRDEVAKNLYKTLL